MHGDAVLAVVASFDGSHCVSTGQDGNVFVYRTRLDGAELKVGLGLGVRWDSLCACLHGVSGGASTVLTLCQLLLPCQDGSFGPMHDSPAVEDIVDSKAYSFEQAKQRAELDRRMRTAEDRKMDERRTVRALRKAFDAILKEV